MAGWLTGWAQSQQCALLESTGWLAGCKQQSRSLLVRYMASNTGGGKNGGGRTAKSLARRASQQNPVAQAGKGAAEGGRTVNSYGRARLVWGGGSPAARMEWQLCVWDRHTRVCGRMQEISRTKEGRHPAATLSAPVDGTRRLPLANRLHNGRCLHGCTCIEEESSAGAAHASVAAHALSRCCACRRPRR